VRQYERWALAAARSGLAAVYEHTDADYPPLFLYALWAVGRVYLAVRPGLPPEGPPPDDLLLRALVKSPHIVADLVLGALLHRLVGREGFWGARRRGSGWGRLAALAYLWNPVVLWGSGYWGQPDGVHSALGLGALAALAAPRAAAAGALWALASLTKPLAAPLAPLLAAGALLRGGLRGGALATLGAAAAGAAVFLPFALGGRLGPVLHRVLADVEAMPFATVNAHNLWWILGGTGRPADAAWFGPLTPRDVGLVLFLAAYAALLVRGAGWMRERALAAPDWGARLVLTAAAVTGTFFFVSTHLHENHLFLALPLLLAVAGRDGRLAWLAAGTSLAGFLNMALHDLELPWHLPGILAAPSPVLDRYLGRPYTWVQLYAGFADALLVLAVVLGLIVAAWRAADGEEGSREAV
jgi:hypothetical protein